LVFPVFYLFVGLATLPAYMKTIPILISREEALKQINACNVDNLNRYSNAKGARISFEEGKYATDDLPARNYTIANSDFDALLDAARAVKDRCGYNFDGFISSVQGFRKEYHSVYITIDQAAKLLNSCTVDKVIYSDPDVLHLKYITGMPTGIELWSKEKPWGIYVKKDLKAATLPIFFEAKKKCPNLEIY
jgi:hypothetical protein